MSGARRRSHSAGGITVPTSLGSSDQLSMQEEGTGGKPLSGGQQVPRRESEFETPLSSA